MKVGSMSRSLTRMGSKQDWFNLRSYLHWYYIPEAHADHMNDSFVSVRAEYRHNTRCHNHPD